MVDHGALAAREGLLAARLSGASLSRTASLAADTAERRHGRERRSVAARERRADAQAAAQAAAALVVGAAGVSGGASPAAPAALGRAAAAAAEPRAAMGRSAVGSPIAPAAAKARSGSLLGAPELPGAFRNHPDVDAVVARLYAPAPRPPRYNQLPTVGGAAQGGTRGRECEKGTGAGPPRDPRGTFVVAGSTAIGFWGL